MAGDHVSVAVVLESGRNFLTDVHTVVATGMEFTAGRRIYGTGNISAQDYALAVPVGIRNGHSREQCFRIGMHRIFEYIFGAGILNKAAEIHYTNFVGDMLDDRKVMRNEYICQPHFLLHVLQQVDYLCLNRDVERGDGFVADDEAGL